MSVLFLILPLAVLLSAVAVAAFVWAAQKGQLDDLSTPAVRILHDDLPPRRTAAGGEARWPKHKSPSNDT